MNNTLQWLSCFVGRTRDHSIDKVTFIYSQAITVSSQQPRVINLASVLPDVQSCQYSYWSSDWPLPLKAPLWNPKDAEGHPTVWTVSINTIAVKVKYIKTIRTKCEQQCVKYFPHRINIYFFFLAIFADCTWIKQNAKWHCRLSACRPQALGFEK